VSAQAKVNLRLRVLARETSGFHQLETLFLRLTLADTVTVRRTEGARTLDVAGSVDAGALGPVERNLAWRAAAAYVEAAGWRDGVAIELVKRIPVGGGLGGGSADAGAVLRALDAIAPAPLGEASLLRIAGTLGADVPFLVSEHAYALGWGRGERLLALGPPPSREVVLLVPAFGVDTAEAYGWLAADRARGGAGADLAEPAGVLDTTRLGSWEALAPLAVNDFEPVVAARHPAIAELVDGLRASGCAPAMMSGSGSVVFGVRPADVGHHAPTSRSSCAVLVTRTATQVEPVSAVE
jgi:4-diphosphocytidyl-2-C-methyl-D-erythritol kinase